jgi:hypothetical protein
MLIIYISAFRSLYPNSHTLIILCIKWSAFSKPCWWSLHVGEGCAPKTVDDNIFIQPQPRTEGSMKVKH